MAELTLKDGQSALIIVAHPDDETIWMGGAILRYPGAAWTILSLSRADDADRAPKFKRVCACYGSRGYINTLDDGGRLSARKLVADAKRIIRDFAADTRFDTIFTHGINGEYGHPLHKIAHRAVSDLRSDGSLVAKRFFAFHYRQRLEKEFSEMIPAQGATHTLELSRAEFARKKAVMTAIYGFDPLGVDTGYCTNPESFKIL